MVSVITCTMRQQMLNNVMANFHRQTVKDKELIVVLNQNDLDFKVSNDNIHILRVDEEKTLGECLNYAASLARYSILAKFDDDDYYSPDYLGSSLQFLKEKRANVAGKAGIFVYFKNDKVLALCKHQFAHSFIKNRGAFLAGGTLVFYKDVLNQVPFQAMSAGEDVQFQKDCLASGFSLYSGGYHDYVLIRYDNEHQHSWKVADEALLRHGKKVAITDSFEEYVWKGEEQH